jgi:putative NIF3 family GTP cyclohydrolase 1 type 2
MIRYTNPVKAKIKKIAVCGGSGSFLLKDAIAAGADAFITADFKYHQFFDADNNLIIIDIGHYESEQFTSQLLFDYLQQKFPTFALVLSKTKTNPINYC